MILYRLAGKSDKIWERRNVCGTRGDHVRCFSPVRVKLRQNLNPGSPTPKRIGQMVGCRWSVGPRNGSTALNPKGKLWERPTHVSNDAHRTVSSPGVPPRPGHPLPLGREGLSAGENSLNSGALQTGGSTQCEETGTHFRCNLPCTSRHICARSFHFLSLPRSPSFQARAAEPILFSLLSPLCLSSPSCTLFDF